MCSGSEAGSYLRLIDPCITQIKAQGPSRTCNESKEEEEEDLRLRVGRTEVIHHPQLVADEGFLMSEVPM